MSDTTPRPDQTPGDPTAPAQPADVAETQVVPAAEETQVAPAAVDTQAAPAAVETQAAPAAEGAQPAPAQAPPPPAPEPQPVYAQQPPPQPAYAQSQGTPQLPPPPPAYGAAAPGTAVAPPNPMSPTEERTTGMAAHGVALAATVLSGGLLGFVSALVMYLIFRDRGPFVRHHTANALNIQIIVGIVMIISVPLMFVLIGFLTFAAAWVFAVVVHVIGMIKANNGEWWNPPMTPQFVK